jgi:pSer/pThr/pTyr-binding forkhead associated (FHA) protein
MSGILYLILRGLLAAVLYAFLIWALYTIWQDLRTQTTMIRSRKIPAITLAVTNTLDDQSLTFITSEVLVGRSTASTYQVRNETVSSNHARLSYHSNQWWVEDLRSTNGTFLNDERIYTPTVIINGDDLRCGQVNIQVNIEQS